MEAPLVKVIHTKSNTYVYDVNTASLLKVSPAVGEVLKNFSTYSQLGDSTDGMLADALALVKEKQLTERLFLPKPSETLKPTLCPQDISNEDLSLCSHVILNLTENCNFNCTYCIYSGSYIGRRTHSPKNMSWDIAKKAVDLLVKNKGKMDENLILGFYGGEPLLSFHLIKKLVEYAKPKLGEHQHLFSLTTNGSLLSDEVIDFLVDNRFAITISLDGPEAVHDRNRCFKDGTGSFQKVIKNIETLRKRAGETYFKDCVSFSAVLTPPYDFQILNSFFADYPILVRVSTLEYNPDYYQNMHVHKAQGLEALAEMMKDYCLNKKEEKKFCSDGLSLPFELFFRQLKKFHLHISQPVQNHSNRVLGLCRPGRIRAFVSCEGSIYACEKTDGNENMLIGDVDNGIQKGRIHRILDDISRLDFSKCQGCWIKHLCNLCFAHLVYKDEYSSAKWQFSCENLRHTNEYILKLYCEIMEQDETALDFFTNVSKY